MIFCLHFLWLRKHLVVVFSLRELSVCAPAGGGSRFWEERHGDFKYYLVASSILSRLITSCVLSVAAHGESFPFVCISYGEKEILYATRVSYFLLAVLSPSHAYALP